MSLISEGVPLRKGIMAALLTVPGAAMPVLWVGFLAVLVVGPWFLPGYIFGTDFSGDRHFDFPNSVHSYAGLEVALALAARVFSAEVAPKLLILLSLITAGLGAYRALPTGGFLPRAIAALVYMINPFVYGRLLYGQLGVVAGYAILPWIVLGTKELVAQPTLKRSATIALGLVLLGIADLHMLLPAGLLMTVLILAHSVQHYRDLRHLIRVWASVLVTVGFAVLASSYWLVPILRGTNDEGRVLNAIGQGDLVAFSPVRDPQLGLIPNLLGLYGFWAEGVGRFASMKNFVPYWPIALAALLVLAAVGAGSVLAAHPRPGYDRAWVIGLLLAAAVAVTLEAGVADNHLVHLVRWIDSVFPPYRGMRDSGKWAAVLAVVYSQLLPLGAIAILNWAGQLRSSQVRDIARALVAGVTIALPLYYGNGLLYGTHRQIEPSQYPAGWYAADTRLLADHHPGRTLVLPWHLYLRLGFVRNANNIIGSPAPTFFSVPIVISHDLEIRGIRAPADADQTTLHGLVRADGSGAWASVLASRGVKYILLLREVDWETYNYLDREQGLIRIRDYGSLVLYRNLLVE